MSPSLKAVLKRFVWLRCRGSVIAIDSAVPRREEAPSSEDADDRTPTAATAAAAAAQAFNLQNTFARNNIISPTASGGTPCHPVRGPSALARCMQKTLEIILVYIGVFGLQM